MGVYMKSLGCSSTSAVANLEFIMVQLLSKAPCIKIAKTLYIATDLLILNLKIFS